MVLPSYVAECISALENAGYEAWCVGGCVRDHCLGLQPADFDLCTSALPEQTEAVFSQYSLVLAGKKHGTVGVITSGTMVEITTFRTEGAYLDNRHPDWVSFVSRVEEDLARRDFTINAMAWSPYRGFSDPFDGREDLNNHMLRAVGDPVQRFREDSLRILRGIRFAVRFCLAVEPATLAAMESEAHLMSNLARERVFEELCKLLPKISAEDLLRFGPILSQVLPPLGEQLGFDQHSPHHAYDLFTHTAHVVDAVPGDLPLRWAALLHDIGKISTFTMDEEGRGHFLGHAGESARMADDLLRQLKSPNALREQVVTLISHHMNQLPQDKKLLRRWLGRLGDDALNQLLLLQEADMGSKGTGIPKEMDPFSRIRQLLEEIWEENSCLSLKDLAVNGHDLMALGISGKAIGRTLQFLLEQVLDEKLPNKRESLLAAATEISSIE